MEKIVIDFWHDDYNVVLDKAAKTNNPYIKTIHYSTTIDNESYIKANGLLPLNILLDRYDSPLYRYLLRYGVHIDVGNRLFYYKNQHVSIKDDYGLTDLWNKLYVFNGQREVFIYTTEKPQHYRYSIVDNFPEILNTITNYLSKYFHVKLKEILVDWLNSFNYLSLYTFDVPLCELLNFQNSRIKSIESIISEVEYIKRKGNDMLAYGIDNSFLIPYSNITSERIKTNISTKLT